MSVGVPPSPWDQEQIALAREYIATGEPAWVAFGELMLENMARQKARQLDEWAKNDRSV